MVQKILHPPGIEAVRPGPPLSKKQRAASTSTLDPKIVDFLKSLKAHDSDSSDMSDSEPWISHAKLNKNMSKQKRKPLRPLTPLTPPPRMYGGLRRSPSPRRGGRDDRRPRSLSPSRARYSDERLKSNSRPQSRGQHRPLNRYRTSYSSDDSHVYYERGSTPESFRSDDFTPPSSYGSDDHIRPHRTMNSRGRLPQGYSPPRTPRDHPKRPVYPLSSRPPPLATEPPFTRDFPRRASYPTTPKQPAFDREKDRDRRQLARVIEYQYRPEPLLPYPADSYAPPPARDFRSSVGALPSPLAYREAQAAFPPAPAVADYAENADYGRRTARAAEYIRLNERRAYFEGRQDAQLHRGLERRRQRSFDDLRARREVEALRDDREWDGGW